MRFQRYMDARLGAGMEHIAGAAQYIPGPANSHMRKKSGESVVLPQKDGDKILHLHYMK